LLAPELRPLAPRTRRRVCAIYLEISAAAGAGPKVFVSGNFHTGDATLYSLLLASEDGGTTWREVAERIPGARFGAVYFANEKTGWVLGHFWNHQPRDPFFLLTTDGGLHWRRYPILNESGTAVVEDFWFDSESTGTVLIDRLHHTESGTRYERYETMTGGTNWMIREMSSKPIDVRRIRPVRPEPPWRTRASEESRAWLVEHRAGDSWEVVAEFSLDAGTCAPTPRELPPPPEPEQPKPPEEAPGGVFRIPGPGEAAPPPSVPPAKPRQPPTLKKEAKPNR